MSGWFKRFEIISTAKDKFLYRLDKYFGTFTTFQKLPISGYLVVFLILERGVLL